MAEDKIVTKKTAPKPAKTAGGTASGAGTASESPSRAAPAVAAKPANAPTKTAAASRKAAVPETPASAPPKAPASPATVAAKNAPTAPPDKAARPSVRPPAGARSAAPRISPEERQRMIEEAAYYIARKREAEGRPGSPEQDWIEAVQQIDAQFGAEGTGT